MKQRLQPALGPLIRRFSRSSYRLTDPETGETTPLGVLPGAPAGALVLPRARVLYTRIALDSVPVKQRKNALTLELEQLAPFANPAGWVLWHGSTACVWYWPAELASRAPVAQKLPAMPEVALWPVLSAGESRWVESPEQGLHLLQFNHPRKGLYEKRFTRAISESEATAWLERHGAQPGAMAPPRPEAIPAPVKPKGESLQATESSLESRILPGALALLVLLAVMYAVAIGRAWWETGQTAETVDARRSEVQSVIELRNRANQLQTELQRLSLQNTSSQVQLAAQLADTLDLQNAELIRWNYRNGQLEVSWQAQTTPPEATAIIRQLEAVQAFSNVQAQLQGENIVEIILNTQEGQQ